MTTSENEKGTQFKDKEKEPCFSQLARDGVSLLLNNKQQDAETLFKKYPDNLPMNAGYMYAVFSDALMTFEDDKLQLALQTLKDIEKKCTANTSWMRSVKAKMFGSDVSNGTYADQLESQIILADSYVFIATLTFLQQDISGYFRGGWVLRKSYKHFQSAYNEILGLYKEIVGDNKIPVQRNNDRKSSIELVTTQAIGTTVNMEYSGVDALLMSTVPDRTEPQCPENEAQTSTTPHSPPLSPTPNNTTISIQSPTSTSNKNGYISYHSSKKGSFPKHSISCHENLTSFTTSSSSGDKPLSNGYVKNSARNAVASGNATSQFRPFLKKSTSFNSTLDDSAARLNNLSLSYFTSSFNIFNNRFMALRDIDKETISRLLCAVSFGYGLLQLGISLLPPSMLRLTSFLGFGGNRKNGLENLMFARLGTDMRAPFATLALLWYHTIVRPFFALDGNNVQAGVEAAAQLIEETKADYSNSALFLFFKGRVERLNSDIPAAITAFQAAIDNAAQREIRLMSLHEVGWCYLIELDFAKSESTFNRLKQKSRWSRSFYSYLTIISAGSNHLFQDSKDVCELRNVFNPASKGTQLDDFLNRRYKLCPLEEGVLKEMSCLYWKLLVYELLYLWNTLPSCTSEHVRHILVDCEAAAEENCEPMIGLAKLIEGSSLCILRRFEDGINSFRDCLEKRKNLPYNCDAAHISAFAQYELGLLLIKDQQTLAEGKRLLQLVAYNYKDYDFEQRLSVRVHAILKHL